MRLSILLSLMVLMFMCSVGLCSEPVFNQANCVRAVIGEASNQGYKGMLAVASGIRNRGTLKGVYGLNAEHVDKQPQWVWDLANKAWEESKVNRLHDGDHWENIKAFGKPYWVDSMKEVYRYKDHVFYKELNQAIGTARETSRSS